MGCVRGRQIDGEITTNGGEYHAVRNNSIGLHKGVDCNVKVGTPVKASLDGVVVRSNFSNPRVDGTISYGYIIVLYHGKNVKTGKHTYTLYAHLDTRNVSTGAQVKQGKIIAKSGNTGGSPKNPIRPHPHFETIEAPTEIDMASPGAIRYGLHRVDPTGFLGRLFYKEPDDLTDEEMDKFYNDIKIDMRLDSKPALLIDLPDYREFIKKVRGDYSPADEEPPHVRLDFGNNFSKEFRSFFPTLELEVNGKNLGRI